MLIQTPPPPPAQLLTGASLWVDDGVSPRLLEGQAVLLEGGRIKALGPEGRLAKGAPKARRVVLDGGVLLPGFIEGHAHVESLGRILDRVDLRNCGSAEAALDRVRVWAAAHPEGWISGRGWDQNLWPGQSYPTSAQLDAVTGARPALLRRVDGHALWANSAALTLAGITAQTPDPEGGRILRDAEGRPNGLLLDRAMDLVEAKEPPAPPTQREAWIQAGLRALQKLGFTSVCDLGGDAATLAAYRGLAARNALPVRVFSHFDFDPKLALQELRAPRSRSVAFFQVQGTKHYFDGALGSRGARMSAPYADAPETRGLWVTSPEQLGREVALVLRAGYQPAAHAIGDEANVQALKVLGGLSRAGGLKPRVEHAQILRPEDARAFGKAGLVASVQPMHMADDHPWTPARLGTERLREAFPWRDFLRGGAPLVFGSDAPIADANPFLALAAAETRQDGAGNPVGGFLPEHRLTRAEALRAYTRDSGRVLGRPELGVLKVGAVADLLWVQAPLMSLSPSELRNLKPGRMWVDGRELDPGATPAR